MKTIFYWCVGIFIVALAVFFMMNSDDVIGNEPPYASDLKDDVYVSEAREEVKIDFQKYNIDYMNDNVKGILVRQAGASGRTAFYLPSTGYVNVTRGSKFGVAWLMQNVDPKVPEGNYFEFVFSPNVESLGDCGVDAQVAQGWIERGWASSGMISGQWREDWDEWFDAMTIYFSFPLDIEACSVKYDFVLKRDGVDYDSRVLVFNLV